MKINHLIAVGLIGSAALAHALPIFPSTGGAVGTIDSNYTITNVPGAVSYVVDLDTNHPLSGISLSTLWTAGSEGEWISPYVSGNTDAWIDDLPNFTYIYSVTLGGTGTGTAYGTFASDNSVSIYINGVSTGISSTGFSTATAFSLTVSAGDVVEFYVQNDSRNSRTGYGNPAGLFVSVTDVPEGGATAVLLGIALLGVFFVQRRISASSRQI